MNARFLKRVFEIPVNGYQKYRDSRQNDLSWFDEVQTKLARWFTSTYKKLLDKKALSLGDDALTYIKEVISECEGGLQ